MDDLRLPDLEDAPEVEPDPEPVSHSDEDETRDPDAADPSITEEY